MTMNRKEINDVERLIAYYSNKKTLCEKELESLNNELNFENSVPKFMQKKDRISTISKKIKQRKQNIKWLNTAIKNRNKELKRLRGS